MKTLSLITLQFGAVSLDTDKVVKQPTNKYTSHLSDIAVSLQPTISCLHSLARPISLLRFLIICCDDFLYEPSPLRRITLLTIIISFASRLIFIFFIRNSSRPCLSAAFHNVTLVELNSLISYLKSATSLLCNLQTSLDFPPNSNLHHHTDYFPRKAIILLSLLRPSHSIYTQSSFRTVFVPPTVVALGMTGALVTSLLIG
jgi:hypothetical protein